MARLLEAIATVNSWKKVYVVFDQEYWFQFIEVGALLNERMTIVHRSSSYWHGERPAWLNTLATCFVCEHMHHVSM